jgi:hypothetical protein
MAYEARRGEWLNTMPPSIAMTCSVAFAESGLR